MMNKKKGKMMKKKNVLILATAAFCFVILSGCGGCGLLGFLRGAADFLDEVAEFGESLEGGYDYFFGDCYEDYYGYDYDDFYGCDDCYGGYCGDDDYYGDYGYGYGDYGYGYSDYGYGYDDYGYGYNDYGYGYDDYGYGYDDYYSSSGSSVLSGYFDHGTSESLGGTTMIITIIASDANYSWNLNDDDDLDTIREMEGYMQIATDYLSDVASDYGKSADFVFDMTPGSELAYEYTFNVNLEEEYGVDEAVWQFIENNVDVMNLQKKYDAENIIFFMIMNTDTSCSAISCTRTWYEGMPYPYEIVYLYNVDYGEVNPPAVYAHEMLHTYGAPDLYQTDSDYGITNTVRNYIEAELYNDIMLVCNDIESGQYVYDRITNTVSELTAYYVGLTNQSSAVDYYHMTQSEHE